jgi:hypothetical protein
VGCGGGGVKDCQNIGSELIIIDDSVLLLVPDSDLIAILEGSQIVALSACAGLMQLFSSKQQRD